MPLPSNDLFEVPDALTDERFNTNPLVLNPPKVRFYAGVPLQSEQGHNLGTLCVIDRKPRVLDPHQRVMLQLMADLVNAGAGAAAAQHAMPGDRSFTTAVCSFASASRNLTTPAMRACPWRCLIFDIDDFRQINMRWGHQAGDQVLLDLCAMAQQQLSSDDLIRPHR